MRGKSYIEEAQNRAKDGRRAVTNQAQKGRSSLEYVAGGVKSGVKTTYEFVVHLVVTYAVIVALLFIASFGILEMIGVDTGIPPEFVGYTQYFSYGILIGLVPAELLRQFIADRQFERLHLVDPATGDAGFRELPPALWEALDVKSIYRDEDTGRLVEVDRDKDHLHRITIDTEDGERTGWECEYYDDATNTAYVSYYGGVSATEIRRSMKEGVDHLKMEASVEREWHERLRRNYTDILEQGVARTVNYFIAQLEGERVPSDDPIRQYLDRKIKQRDVDDILEFGRHPKEEIDGDNPFEESRLSEKMQQNAGEGDE